MCEVFHSVERRQGRKEARHEEDKSVARAVAVVARTSPPAPLLRGEGSQNPEGIQRASIGHPSPSIAIRRFGRPGPPRAGEGGRWPGEVCPSLLDRRDALDDWQQQFLGQIIGGVTDGLARDDADAPLARSAAG